MDESGIHGWIPGVAQPSAASCTIISLLSDPTDPCAPAYATAQRTTLSQNVEGNPQGQ
jgi:hypothetical protein